MSRGPRGALTKVGDPDMHLTVSRPPIFVGRSPPLILWTFNPFQFSREVSGEKNTKNRL
jgi:hypothetical protein